MFELLSMKDFVVISAIVVVFCLTVLLADGEDY